MATETKIVELRIPSNSDRLKLVRSVVNCVAQMFNFSQEDVDALVLAVNEACMNIIQHGYGDKNTGEIILDVTTRDANLVFRLTDFATTCDKSRIRSRDLSELRPGGLGVHLMQEVMDKVEYFDGPNNCGNIVELSKRLQQRQDA